MHVRGDMRRFFLGTLEAALTALVLLVALATSQGAAAESVSWQAAYNGYLSGSDAFTAVEAAGGDAYAAGYTAASWANRSDILFARYAADGTRSWVRTWNGPVSGSDQCWALTRDRKGSLCLAGSTAGHGGDAVLLRYAPSGRLAWFRRFDTGSQWQDDARFIAKLAGSDAVYVVVESRTDTLFRTSVLRYSLSGKRVWARKLAPGVRVTGAVTDADDNLYLSGWSGSSSGSEAVLSSLAPDGSTRWTTSLPGSAPVARATAVTDAGDGIAWTMTSAASLGALGRGDVLASHYTPFAQLWEVGAGVTAPHELASIAATRSGSVVAVGRVRAEQGDQGLALVVDSSGAANPPLTWSHSAGCRADLVAGSSDGSSWIAGRTGYGFSLLHLMPSSGLAWRHDYDDRPSGRVLALCPASDGGVYAAGWGRKMGGAADALLMRVTP